MQSAKPSQCKCSENQISETARHSTTSILNGMTSDSDYEPLSLRISLAADGDTLALCLKKVSKILQIAGADMYLTTTIIRN
jgi:hypothetical protein